METLENYLNQTNHKSRQYRKFTNRDISDMTKVMYARS